MPTATGLAKETRTYARLKYGQRFHVTMPSGDYGLFERGQPRRIQSKADQRMLSKIITIKKPSGIKVRAFEILTEDDLRREFKAAQRKHRAQRLKFVLPDELIDEVTPDDTLDLSEAEEEVEDEPEPEEFEEAPPAAATRRRARH
jgi:hypothetical protein